MRYQVFIAKSESKLQGAALLQSVGLEDHAKGFDTLPIAKGPDGKPGTLFAWLDHEQTRICYEPDKQTWIPSLIEGDRKAGAYWVGIWKDSPPTEKDLRRPEGRTGVLIPVADGSVWRFPLPDTLERFAEIKDGELTWVVDQAFAWFCSEIEMLKATRIRREDEKVWLSLRPEEDFKFAVRALRINYRITPEIVAALRLISVSKLNSITAKLMNFPLLDEETEP